MTRPANDELRARLIQEKGLPVLRALKTEDGKVLLAVLKEGQEELRHRVGSPIDPYALAMAEGAQRLIDKLIMFRDAAETTTQRSNTNV